MSLFKFGFTGAGKGGEKEGQGDVKGKEGNSKEAEEKKEQRSASKKKYEDKRQRKFSDKWKKEFPWVEHDSEKNIMFCSPCRKYDPSKVGRFLEGTDNYRVDALRQHDSSSSHIAAQRKYDIESSKEQSKTVFCTYTGEVDASTKSAANAPGTSTQQRPAVIGPLDLAVRKLNEGQKAQLLACFNTAYFVAKNELPFTLYPKLLDLQAKNGVSLPSSYLTDMACRRFMAFIFQDITQDNYQALKNARVISIMFDGATDVSVTENELVYARIVIDGVPTQIYIKIQDVEHAHALGVLAAIEKAMDSVDPDGWNWKEKLVGTGSDGANVNLGKRHSVVSLLKEDVPYLVPMHCVCHRLELGALDAMKDREAKVFADLKSVLMNLHKHYHYSPKALRELHTLAEAMQEKSMKPVNLEGTRWMPHLSRCLDVLLKQYLVFVAHFENTVSTKSGTVDVQSRAKLILKHLTDYRLLHYMHLLKDILAVLSQLSLQFQKNTAGIPDAVSALETACLQLIALKQRPGDNLRQFLEAVDDQNQFKGIKLTALGTTEAQLKTRQDTLIDSVLDHICKRVGDIDSDHLLKDMQVFFPVNLLETDAERAVYGEDQVAALCEYFSTPLRRMGCDIEHLKSNEWPALKAHMNQQPSGISSQVFFNRLFTNPNLQDNFKNSLMLAEIILCIPVASAICERGFSAMARIKCDWRSKLNPEMLNYLMAISIVGPEPNDYNAARALSLWWHGGERSRKPEFGEPELC